ncbi:glucuronate isomerase [Maribacter confluentis]|uniref:Uronate isomerase n=1 Tax=Maribacter confluentis TaxID=1656093 RepID=A0ABT8RU00_9FLAO|nr:glucuronate isomerase [Maribacter confluentis]MDO1513854.1 glucuronate isomerase [Maribacter confluentis]
MSNFLNSNFLLENKFSQELYHDYACKMPIIDYHNHLPPELIANNYQFDNLTNVWIDGDHYKWRAMRTLGIKEDYITGNASDEEKFLKWAQTVPYTMRNPLYHWTHLELQRYFGIDELLTPKSAHSIYKSANEQLKEANYNTQGLLNTMNVEFLCTTEDPTDSLDNHKVIAKSTFKTKVSTAFRPDNAIHIDAPSFNGYIIKLSDVSGVAINSLDTLREALRKRIRYFHEHGCRIADHGLSHMYASEFSENQVNSVLKKKLDGKTITEDEIHIFKSAVLMFLSKTYHELGWVQQFHLGALRNNNTRMLNQLGPNTGWDSIGDWLQAEHLSNYLNQLDGKDQLCKTIIYNLNPRDNEVFASMIGNFNDGSLRGKVQFGSGWWFLDQKDGMTKQINALSNIGLISCFIGMLTDSRSFLSFPRHEYFRRILCNLFGTEIENGELPNDMEWIGSMVQDICYNNAKEYFEL